MSVIKNEIPILEYDTDSRAVIMPDHEGRDVRLPEAAVLAFVPSETIDRFAAEHGGRIVSEFLSVTKTYPLWVIEYRGKEISLVQAPVGAPASAQILDWLIAYGAKKIISGGSCGALCDYKEGVFLVPKRALRDEGTSYHYAAPSRFIDVSDEARRAIEKALADRGIKYAEVTTWSTDGFYRETKALTEYRKAEGCSVVEMECSALAACAKMRGALWGEILFTADTLADTDNYDARDFGASAVDAVLELCCDAALNV